VEQIEREIGGLSRDQFFELITWIRSRYEDEWDRQIEDDVKAGRLENLAREAIAEYHAGRTTPFPPDDSGRKTLSSASGFAATPSMKDY
jgi:hypothetical protein